MKLKKKTKKGFTLIELLIVIAIIAILAAIAIPQFSAYRIRGFNSSAESDARNWKTTEEAGNSSFFSYMNSEKGVIPAAAPAIGAGTLLQGPLTAATSATSGAFLQTPFVATRVPNINTVMGAVGIGVGNNVNIAADNVVSATDPNIAATAQVFAKHFEGDTVFFVDMDSTALYWCKNSDQWIKVAYPALPGYAAPANTYGADDGNNIACGGVPIANWVAL